MERVKAHLMVQAEPHWFNSYAVCPQTLPTKMDGKTLMEHPSRTLPAPSAESPHPFKPSSVLAYLVKLSAKALSF